MCANNQGFKTKLALKTFENILCVCVCGVAHLSLYTWGSRVQQGKQVLHECQLLSEVLAAHVGATQSQDHGQQLKAVGVWGGIIVTGLRVGVLFAGDGVLPLLSHTCGLHTDGLDDVGAHLELRTGVRLEEGGGKSNNSSCWMNRLFTCFCRLVSLLLLKMIPTMCSLRSASDGAYS